MNVVTDNKWIGQRTIRPDGVDKVTGRAPFAADTNMPGMIWGKVLRSPHPHARIKSIDTTKAEALPGVKAVVTSRDIVDFTIEKGAVMLGIQDMRWMCRNVMAREKALFPGHPVAAVAATTEAIAAQACELIEIDYEVLPFAIEIDDAIKPDAPILHEFNKFEGKPSNIAGRLEHKKGDIDEGFKQAEVVIERTLHHAPGAPGLYRAARLPDQRRRRQQDHDLELEPGPVHGARDDVDAHRHPAERHPRHPRRDRRRLWRQDHRLSRAARDHAREKIRPAGQDGDDARRSDARHRAHVRLEEHGEDRRQEGRHDRRRARHVLPAGRRIRRARRSAARSGCSFSPYDIPNVLSVGFRCGLQPLKGRGLSCAGRADRRLCGGMRARRTRRSPEDGSAGVAAEERAPSRAPRPRTARSFRASATSRRWRPQRNSPHYKAPLGKLQGRGVASGFWFNAGGESQRNRQHHRGRQCRRHHGPSRHRRLARGDRQHLRRIARHRLPPRLRHHRRHRRPSASPISPAAAACCLPPRSW